MEDVEQFFSCDIQWLDLRTVCVGMRTHRPRSNFKDTATSARRMLWHLKVLHPSYSDYKLTSGFRAELWVTPLIVTVPQAFDLSTVCYVLRLLVEYTVIWVWLQWLHHCILPHLIAADISGHQWTWTVTYFEGFWLQLISLAINGRGLLLILKVFDCSWYLWPSMDVDCYLFWRVWLQLISLAIDGHGFLPIFKVLLEIHCSLVLLLGLSLWAKHGGHSSHFLGGIWFLTFWLAKAALVIDIIKPFVIHVDPRYGGSKQNRQSLFQLTKSVIIFNDLF